MFWYNQQKVWGPCTLFGAICFKLIYTYFFKKHFFRSKSFLLILVYFEGCLRTIFMWHTVNKILKNHFFLQWNGTHYFEEFEIETNKKHDYYKKKCS